MLNIQMTPKNLQNMASQTMAEMITENVWRSSDGSGQTGKLDGDDVAILWETIDGTDVLSKIITGNFNFYG